MMSNKIINNTRNLDVASNEYATKYSAWRIFKKLLENDRMLEKFYNQIFGQAAIYQYQYGTKYKYNDIVWFIDGTSDLHILRFNKDSIDSVETGFQNLHRWDPNGTIPLSRFGWYDLNPDVDVLKDFGLDKLIRTYLTRAFKQHADDPTRHPFGRLSWQEGSSKNIEAKIAKRDLSNVDPRRENVFFPYHTFYLAPGADSPIMAGQCRWYDNGLLEYDLVFRLSYQGYKLVNEEYGEYADILSANTLEMVQKDVDKYFISFDDGSIFMPKNLRTYQSEIGETIQQNRNDIVNVYSAKIDFANAIVKNTSGKRVQFRLLNQTSENPTPDYMIFSSDIMCQDRNLELGNLNPSQNALCFCQKEQGSFCAFLLTYAPLANAGNAGFNAQNGGLQANSFHCKLVGRHT